MKKVLTFDRRPEVVSSGSFTDNGRSSAGGREPGYLIQNRDLGKIHKAASGGDQAKVKDILLPQIHDVDDRDKMNRSSKEISHKECKVKEKMNSMDDPDCLTQSTEAISEHCLSPHSNYENFTLLTKQLCKDCKGSTIIYIDKREKMQIDCTFATPTIQSGTEELIAASTCNHSPEDNTDQLEEEIKVLQKKCEEMTPRAAWWKQEVIRVRRQMEINRAKHLEELQRLDRIGECARPDIAYRSEQIRQFYQDFFAL